jgi:hypothetical protein
MSPETTCDTLQRPRAREGREGRILSLLLAGRTLTEICAATRISRQTVWRIRRRPEFEESFKAARSELLSGVLHKLQNDGADYADVLHALATNEKARGSDRVQAARNGLDLMFRGVELFDFEQRLQKLESIAGGGSDNATNRYPGV